MPDKKPVANGANGSAYTDVDSSPVKTVLADKEQLDRVRAAIDPHRLDTDQIDPRQLDTDQLNADGDQAASDRDQAASDRDQIASDSELARGGDPAVHDTARVARDSSAVRREQAARVRVELAAARDAAGRMRDLAAVARDQAAAQRDRELAARDANLASNGHAATGMEVLLRAGEYRTLAATERVAAASFRARAAAEREQAAREREQAANDRLQAQLDRDALLHELTLAETDHLTGARTRAAGLADLGHEIDRARRSNGHLVVSYIDVVDLKAVNDTYGHMAGDELLQRVVAELRGHMRSYDLIIRMGGDEFLCALSDVTAEVAAERFEAVQLALATQDRPRAFRAGIAELVSGDSLTALIERADAQLAGNRRR